MSLTYQISFIFPCFESKLAFEKKTDTNVIIKHANCFDIEIRPNTLTIRLHLSMTVLQKLRVRSEYDRVLMELGPAVPLRKWTRRNTRPPWWSIQLSNEWREISTTKHFNLWLLIRDSFARLMESIAYIEGMTYQNIPSNKRPRLHASFNSHSTIFVFGLSVHIYTKNLPNYILFLYFHLWRSQNFLKKLVCLNLMVFLLKASRIS